MYVYRNELDGTNKEKMAVYAGAGIEWISNCVQQDEKIYFDGSLKLPDLRGEQD